MAPSAYPYDLAPPIEVAPFEREVAAARGASATFNGNGGDCLFGNHSREFGLQEYVRRHGWGPRAIQIAQSTAFLTNDSILGVLKSSVRNRLFHKKDKTLRDRMAHGRQLVRPEAAPDVERIFATHSWFSGIEDMPWGMIPQLGMMLQNPMYYDPLQPPATDGLESVDLLSSQPIAELCLRIPLYVHLLGARDRALERRAFRNEVPKAILDRQWKDRAPGFFDEVFQWNRNVLKEQLLDGQLVKEGLLDRQKLEGVFAGLRSRSAAYVNELLDHFYVEAWVRSWTPA